MCDSFTKEQCQVLAPLSVQTENLPQRKECECTKSALEAAIRKYKSARTTPQMLAARNLQAGNL